MRTFVQRGPQYDLAPMEAVYQALHAEAAAHLAADCFRPNGSRFSAWLICVTPDRVSR